MTPDLYDSRSYDDAGEPLCTAPADLPRTLPDSLPRVTTIVRHISPETLAECAARTLAAESAQHLNTTHHD